jgi:hypothetical protein
MKKSLLILFLLTVCGLSLLLAKDDTKPPLPKKSATSAYSSTGFSHKVNSLWTQVTNYGFYGDRSYTEPNFEWPGGSGNIYGWLTSIWVGGIVDTIGYISSGESNHFTPLDTIHVTYPPYSLSAEDTYTRYTDVDPPSPTGDHYNLGTEISEHTYVWDQSYNDDFIISDYWIKFVGNKNGTLRNDTALNGVFVGFRMDADVSGFLGSTTTQTLWATDDLVGTDSLNRLVYLYDADSPVEPGDDTGNPDPVNPKILRSPGYIGIRVLSYDSAHFVGKYNGMLNMATPTYRNQEPTTAQQRYEFLAKNKIAPDAKTPYDYRGIVGIGPFRLPKNDSIHVAVAWVIGNGLKGVITNSQIAQSMYDGKYLKAPSAPDVPNLTVNSIQVNGTSAIALRWARNAESNKDPLTNQKDFDGYAVYRTERQDAGGNPIWDTLAVYVLNNAISPKDTNWIGRPFLKNWPPPYYVSGSDTMCQFIQPGISNGLIYTYAVTAFDRGDTTLGINRLENPIGRGRGSTKVFMANAPAQQSVQRIRVVPNPFMGSSKFNNPNPIDNNPWVNRIRFINLPPDAKITIFTLVGDLVKSIKAGDIVYRSRDAAIAGDFSGVAEWDLVTRNNQEAVSGLYIYSVESSYGNYTGKFVIIR